jgi:hypothetical protein
MVIGITIDGCLRNTLGKLNHVLEKYHGRKKKVKTYDFSKELKFLKNKIIPFLFQEHSLEIFGHASESEPNIINFINSLILDGHKIKLISREFGKGIPSTLFFLSKYSCTVSNLTFTETYSELWEECDLIVSDNKMIFDLKPEGKDFIKLNTEDNKDWIYEKSINSIKELKEIL